MVGVRKLETSIIGDGPECINIKKPLKLRAEDRVFIKAVTYRNHLFNLFMLVLLEPQ
jgi:hypothetical protein